jgi:gluconate kinase
MDEKSAVARTLVETREEVMSIGDKLHSTSKRVKMLEGDVSRRDAELEEMRVVEAGLRAEVAKVT